MTKAFAIFCKLSWAVLYQTFYGSRLPFQSFQVGFGLGEATRTAPAAFLSSCHSTRCLVMHLILKNVVSIRDSNSVVEKILLLP